MTFRAPIDTPPLYSGRTYPRLHLLVDIDPPIEWKVGDLVTWLGAAPMYGKIVGELAHNCWEVRVMRFENGTMHDQDNYPPVVLHHEDMQEVHECSECAGLDDHHTEWCEHSWYASCAE